MKSRILAAVAAVVLAVLGTLVLTAYVSGADQRALQGAAAVQVLVVKAPIAAGTAADKLTDLVSVQSVPAKSEAVGAVASLDKLAGKVASVDLVPGEQLINSRFVDPAALKAKTAAGKVDVPAGMQEVSILLEPQRVVGGDLARRGHRRGPYFPGRRFEWNTARPGHPYDPAEGAGDGGPGRGGHACPRHREQ